MHFFSTFMALSLNLRMKYSLQFIFLLLFPELLSGQNTDVVGGLELAIKNTNEDTVKVRLLNELALQYESTDTSRAITLLQQAYDISENASYAIGLGMYNESMGGLNYYHGHYVDAIRYFEEARSQYLLAGENIKMAGVIVDEGNSYLFLSEYEIALEKYEAALVIFKDVSNVEGMSRCLNNMGIIYKNFGEYAKALESYRATVDLLIEDNDENSLIDLYINIGVVFVKQGDYMRALENFNKALMYAEQTDNKEMQAISLMNSGVIHNKMSDYDKALVYYEKALIISKEIGDKVEISKCLTNIGTNYISQQKYDIAKEFVTQGLEIKLELGSQKSIANCYNFLAEIHYHLEEYQESIDMDNQAIELKRKVNDPEGLARCFSNISRTYLALGNQSYALIYADSSLNYGRSIGALEHIISAYLIKKEIFEAQGKYKEAFELGELYKIYSDSLLNENNVRAVNEIELKYQSQVLEEENEFLRVQAELNSVLISRHRKIIILVSVALLMIVFSIVLLFIIQRKQRQYNHSLEKKNQIITKQNIKLGNYNRTKDKILSVITHDLRGTIGNQLTALSVLAKEEFRDEEERKVVFSRLANSATLSLEILENLTLWTKIQEEQLSYLPEEAYMDKSFADIIDVFQESIKNKDLMLVNEIKDEYPCFYDQFMIKSVLKNLLSNAIKFSNRGGAIHCGISLKDEFICIYISDNGIGISSGEISKLQEGIISKMRRGTENEKGSGLGFSVVKAFLDYHNTSLKIESTSSIGTKVSFHLPLKRPS
jgi:signal transduction histidine kinase/Tfp pilus assembly protein PilF